MSGALNIICFKGICYWGTIANSKANEHRGVLFRRKQMVQGRWYGSTKYQVRYSIVDGQGPGEKLICFENNFGHNNVHVLGTYEYIVVTHQISYLHRSNQARNEYRCFLNRRLEYPNSPFIPMYRGNRAFASRWFKQELLP